MPLHRFVWVLFLLFAALPPAARAQGQILHRAVLEDPSRNLAIEDMPRQAFLPLPEMLSQGFSGSAFWLRLEIAPLPDGGPIRLRIVPSLLDDIRLFAPDPARPGAWLQTVSGDTQRFESSDRSLHSLGFIFHPAAPSTTYYLRIVTTSSVMADIQAMPVAESNRRDALYALGQMVYLAFMGFVLLWVLRSYRQHPDRVTGFFIAHQSLSLLMSAAVMGSFAPFWSAAHPRLINDAANLLLLLNGLFAVMFHRRFWALFAPPRQLMRAMALLAAVFPLCLAAYAAGWERQALQANAYAHLALGVLLFAFALALKPHGGSRLRTVRITYLLLGLILIVQLVTAVGWLGGSRHTLWSAPLYFSLSAGLMLHLLAARAERLAADAARKLREGELAMQHLALEKQYAAEQERFTEMLTHELKTPLSVALMSVGAMKSDSPYLGRIRQALASMNDIVDHSRLVELVRNKRLPVNLALTNLSERVYECIEAAAEPQRIHAAVGFELETRTDAHLFGIIVANLIDNALKYSPPALPVELRLEPAADAAAPGLVLVVRNVIGAAGAPDPAQVFSKYYRSPGAHNKTGSGLGLHLCQHLAGLIGARLSFDRRGDIVEFALCLPA